MRRPRTVLSVVVVATVLLAGCLGGAGTPGGADTTATSTPTPTSTPTGDDAAADRVRDAVLAAVDDVETYAFEGRMVQRYRGEVNQTATTNTTGVIDRRNRTVRVNQSQSSSGRTYRVQTYVVEDTVFSHSDFYTQDYGSEWIERTPANLSDYFDTVDTLARQRAVLAVANVSLAGNETVAGTETRVLNASVTPAEYRRLADRTLAGDGLEGVTVEDVSFRFWVASDTHRLVRSTGSMNLTVDTGRRNVSVAQSLTVDYTGYGRTVNVTLPTDARKEAVNVSERET